MKRKIRKVLLIFQKLGLNFAPAPKKRPLIDTVTAVQAVTMFLSEDKAND